MSNNHMPIRARILVALLAGVMPSIASAETLTLDDVVELAIDHQPSLASAHARIDGGSASVELVDAEKRPTLSASAGYNLGAGLGGSLVDPAQSVSATLAGGWQLWDFGKQLARRDAAAAGVTYSEVALTQAERAVLHDVELAYVQVIGATAQAEVRSAAVEAEKRHLDEAERLVAAGKRTQIDVAQAKARLASATVDEVEASNAISLAIAGLERAIGTTLPESASFQADWPSPVVGEDDGLDELLARSIRTDPDLASLRAQTHANELSRVATRISTRPTLALNASLGVGALGTYGVPPDDERIAGSWAVGLTLTWQLYDGGAREAQLDAADADLRVLDAEHDARVVELRYQLESARLSVVAAKETRFAASDSVVAANEQLRLATASFQSGLGTSSELADAQDAVTEARGVAANAESQLATARATLRYLLDPFGSRKRPALGEIRNKWRSLTSLR